MEKNTRAYAGDPTEYHPNGNSWKRVPRLRRGVTAIVLNGRSLTEKCSFQRMLTHWKYLYRIPILSFV